MLLLLKQQGMKVLWISAIALVTVFSGCDQCYNVACDEPDVAFINGLQFEFDRQSYSYEEVNAATVLRFHPGNFEQPIDTLFLKGILTPDDFSFHISLEHNDRAQGDLPFVYGIYDNSHENAYIVSNIDSKGIYPTDCCCCYRNTDKTFLLNGEERDRTGTTDAVVLRK